MWIIYSLFSSAATSVRVPVVKNIINKQNEYVALWVMFTFPLPFALLMVLIDGVTIINSAFWMIVTLRVMLDMISGMTEMKAYKFGAISYVVPLMSLSALFSTISGYLINGQTPSMVGLLAVGLVTISVALLYFAEKKMHTNKINRQGLFKATMYLLFTLVLWAIANALHKEGIDRSSPYTYFFISYIGLAIGATLLVVFVSRKSVLINFKGKQLGNNLFLGFLVAIDRILFLTALISGFTGYVIAIQNVSVIVVAALGFFLFKEKINGLKIFSILLGFVGVILFAISG